jgi:hypothetical protein
MLAVSLAVAFASPALAAHKSPPHIKHFTAPTQTITAPVMTAQQLDNSYMVAAAGDLIGYGTAAMRYDSNANLYVTLAGTSGITALPPLTGGATGIPFAANQGLAIFGSNGATEDALTETGGALNTNDTIAAISAALKLQDGSPQLSGAALRTGCSGSPVCTFTTTAITTLYAIIYAGPALSGTSTITCYDNTSATGDFIILYPSNMGNTQILQYGPTGYHLQNGKVSCQTAGAVLGATANLIVLAR